MTPATANDKPLIYSMAVCPYAQRTKILLEIKGVDYDAVEIDISKPRSPAFLEINPTGKVPTLVHNGKVLNESSIINEYLDEVFPEIPLLPTDPYQKAISRLLIDYCNTRFSPNHYRLLMEQNSARREKIEQAVHQDWLWLDAFLRRTNPDGQYVGESFGMADLTYAPFFARFVLNEYFWDFQLAGGGVLDRVCRWRDVLREHPTVMATNLCDEHYIKLYADYALGYSNGALPPGRERSSFDLSVPLEARPMPFKTGRKPCV